MEHVGRHGDRYANESPGGAEGRGARISFPRVCAGPVRCVAQSGMVVGETVAGSLYAAAGYSLSPACAGDRRSLCADRASGDHAADFPTCPRAGRASQGEAGTFYP